eukprot:671257-Pyramimonas_sp.AAC.1
MTEKKQEELRAAFDLLDIDSDGALTGSELLGLLAAMDIESSMAAQVMAAMDTDGDRVISFEELKHALETQKYYMLQ